MKLLAVRKWLGQHRESLLLGVLTLICFGATVYWCFPGFMARDSGLQLEQARNFEFFDDHPILMALIWHYTDRVLPGPLGMLVLMSGLCWAGLGSFFWALPGDVAWRALGLLAVGFFPPVFAILPIILKDALMQGGLLVALACVLMPTRRALVLRLCIALVCLLIALGARHNCAAAAWPFVALPLSRIALLHGKARWLRLLAASAAGMAVTLALTWALGRALAPLTHRTEFWQTVPIFDLAGMSLRAEELLVEQETHVLTEGMGLEQLQQVFNLNYGPFLYYCIPFAGQRCVHVFSRTLDPAELKQISGNWLRAIRYHPGAYLAHRLGFAREILNVSAGDKELYYLNGAPHHWLAEEYPPRRRTLRLMAAIERKIHWIGYRPWLYAALNAALLPLALIAYLRGRSMLPLLFTFSGSAYLLSTLLGASSTDYRYLVWTILCALLALITLLVTLIRARGGALGPARCLSDD
jgi:hypothetical protein